jgi:hypothetical protein
LSPRAVQKYSSVLDVLDQPGCPICTFLRNEQSGLLQGGIETPPGLCNFHAWGIAAVQDATSAARLFLASLDRLEGSSGESHGECSICSRLREQESAAIADLTASANRSTLDAWFRHSGGFCVAHSHNFRAKAPLRAISLLNQSDAAKKRELRNALISLATQSSADNADHRGILGRVAEYLVSQRGLSH